MAEQSGTPGPAPVSDHRPVPRGVLPRGFQTWLMAGLALGIVLIILIAGQPEPPVAPAQTATAPLAPNPDRLRDYQERLRAMETRQAQEAQATAPPATMQQPVVEPSAPAPEDPIVADRKRREYENHHYWSMFGAAAAVGLISGLAQWIGTAGFTDGPGDRTVIIAGGADAASQASLQVMSRFLNRLPTITIREGHRVKVYLTSDLQLPAYAEPRANRF